MLAETNQTVSIPQRNRRTFIAENIDFSNWEAIEPYYKNLLERDVNSLEGLENWLKDRSELDAAASEDFRWIIVSTTIDTSDEKAKAALTNQYVNIFPKISLQENLLDKKFIASPFIEQLDEKLFYTTIRKIKKSVELFREENIPLQSELKLKESVYDQIAGAQSIHYNGKELTVQQASVFIKSTDRKQREEVFNLISERKLKDADKLDELLSELIQLRQKIAVNAGYKNFMEYRFDELSRFDYTSQDCLKFHGSVEEVLMPLVNQMSDKRKEQLNLGMLKPWDVQVDTSGKPPLKPFNSTEELTEKTIICFNLLDPYFAQRIEIMRQMKYLDLDSRMNKAPGGYNVTMPEIGVPFIFMNSANSETDLVTMVHEGGHAVHTFLSHPLQLNAFKETTSETAEVASMAMELLSMEHWDVFYSDADDLKRAKKNQLESIPGKLAKICMGDSFQFWLYLNPNHSVEERRKKWSELQQRFTPQNVDWSGHESYFETSYQSILHFYQVPFYYIEYAFAQLGAVAVWKNYKQNPESAIDNYKKALGFGYTVSIPAFYEIAGAKFDFSKEYISDLASFLKAEVNKL
ncbi:MAG: M3 family oligoendopeptidase [Bacteroidota bacterium]